MLNIDGELTLSPSDLTRYLACPHLASLELDVANGVRKRPHGRDELVDLIAAKGALHEARYLESLSSSGREVVSIDLPEGVDGFDEAATATKVAMHAGADVIYQATFVRDRWRGRADFVIRVDTPSDLGSWSYEPFDTKLALSAKPAAVLQLAWYAGEIEFIQKTQPENVHVVLGTTEVESFRTSEVDAYLRIAQARLRSHVDDLPETYPWRCEHCQRCDFAPACREQWVRDDHLTRVASIRRDQIRKLGTVELTTLTALGDAPMTPHVPRLAPAMAEKLRDQAALQLRRYRTGELTYRILPPEAERGLGLLPEPSPGDLFFDIEGDPFFDPSSKLEFLFGVLWQNDDGTTSYHPFWACDRESELKAFESFIDLVRARQLKYPTMHVYHYAAYEPTTLARLMSSHASREEEVDELLRGEVLVDLFRVVRQSIRAGVESYSLKEIEQLFFTRRANVTSGNAAVVEFERWLDDRDPIRLDAIAAYNEEDCRATLELRDWLIGRRPESEAQHRVPISFRPAPERDPAPAAKPVSGKTERLREDLMTGSGDDAGRILCAQILEYHRREARPAWWWYYRRLSMTDEELEDDAEALGFLEHDGEEPVPIARSLEWRFTFPPQQHRFDDGDQGLDPRPGGSIWTVTTVDNAQGSVGLKRDRAKRNEPMPTSLVPFNPYRFDAQEAALRRLAESVLADDGRYPHLEQVLRREEPRAGRRVQCTTIEEQRELLDDLTSSYLVVQGPPGSGKTYRGARLITHLLRQRKRVGIVAQSHRVIHKLLDEVEKAAAEEALDFKGIKRGGDYRSAHIKQGDVDALHDPDVLLFAGTAWFLSRQDFDGHLDALFVDEAGQYSLADSLACGTAARQLVLLGDPLQLAHVRQGVHPGGSGASILEHLIGEHETIPEEMGVFLNETRRLHPEVCRFVSGTFYEGRLRSIPECANRWTSDGVGTRWLAVEHEGNRVDSEEEAEAIAIEIERLTSHTFYDAASERRLTYEDFMVVAAFNSQVRMLRTRLPPMVEVGTVDKFQGREAPVVFYSMASSTGEDVPRGLNFLMSRNRLNVAVSRAQCLAYVACSPRLLEVDCRTVEHLRLVNALCSFVEFAQ